MKGKIKKILTTTLLSAVSVTAIGCGSTGNKLAKNIDKSMAQFVSSVNNLDYVETNKSTGEKLGKIVETSSNLTGSRKILTDENQIKFLNNNISEAQIENTITRPTDRQDDFKLFILSDTPFISLSNDDEKSFTVNVKFSTDKIEETSSEIDQKINTLILKRSILMIYVNEIYNDNVVLSEENKTSINAYVNIIKENASFLNGNRGMVKNQLKIASDLAEKNTNENLVNYYIIKSNEALETRANKFDSTISAIDAIINIIEQNLSTNSNFYNTKLSSSYENFLSNHKAGEKTEITANSSNKEIADTIYDSLSELNKFTVKNQGSLLESNSETNVNAQKGIMTLPLTENNEILNKNLNKNTLSQENLTPGQNQNVTKNITNSQSNDLKLNNQNLQRNQLGVNQSQNNLNLNSTQRLNNNQLTQNNAVTNQTQTNGANTNSSQINNLQTNNSQQSNQQINNSKTSNQQINNTQANNPQNNRLSKTTSNNRHRFNRNNRSLNNRATNQPNSSEIRNRTYPVQQRTNSHTILNDGEEQNINENISRMTSSRTRRNNQIMQRESENEKTIRAERNPERVTNEQYTVSSNNEIRATRTPYKTN